MLPTRCRGLVDTAFAVLFLKRAVPPPVATGGGKEPK